MPLHVGAVERFVAWASERFGIGPGTAVLSYAPLNFDLCLLDIWTTLARGGRVVLVDSDQSIHAGTVLDLIAHHRVSVVQAVPMFFRLLIDGARSSGRALPEVAHVIFTGDAIPIATLTELPRLFPAAPYNIYGCTETNDSFIHEVEPRAPPPPKSPG